VYSGMVEELEGVVGVMAINNKEACMTVGPLCCVFLEVGKPEYGQFAIRPPFLRVTEPFAYVQYCST